LHPARSGKAAFEHILAVEMRALAIGGRDRMDHRGLLLAVHPREFRHRRMQREERIQHQRGVGSAGRQRDRAVQAGIIRVADRGDGRKAVQCAAQDDDDQTRIAPIGGTREFRQISPGRKGSAAEQHRTARRRCRAFAAIRFR
jgi:hypothetical protein